MHPRGHPACPRGFFDDFDAKVQDARRHVSCHELMTSVMAKESTYLVLENSRGAGWLLSQSPERTVLGNMISCNSR